jgi:glycosyltransferase involved in cell wall biosynthesis
MKHGVPCVAFDCPFGPSSIINDASCGFLVENGDISLFAERLCRLIEDEGLRKDFSKAAIERANTFDIDIIMNKTKVFYEKLFNET